MKRMKFTCGPFPGNHKNVIRRGNSEVLKDNKHSMRHHERGNPLFRLVDRYIGIPVIFLMSFLKAGTKNKPAKYNKIALLKTAGIGDTIILSGAIRSLQETYPKAEIVLFCGENNAAIARILLKNIMIVALPLMNIPRTVSIIRKMGRFDTWLDFGPWPRYNAFLSTISKANQRIGFITKGQYRHYCYDIKVPHIDHVEKWHELSNYNEIVKQIGVKPCLFPLTDVGVVPKREHQIAIHIFPGGSRSYLKEWPKQNWLEVIIFLLEKSYNIVLTGGKGDRLPIEQIISNFRGSKKLHNSAGELNIFETARVLKESQLVISVDTGIMHLASSLDCNLIALHGPTSPGRWGPCNEAATVISTSTCSKRYCIDLGFENICTTPGLCMKAISPKTVIDAIKNTLHLD